MLASHYIFCSHSKNFFHIELPTVLSFGLISFAEEYVVFPEKVWIYNYSLGGLFTNSSYLEISI